MKHRWQHATRLLLFFGMICWIPFTLLQGHLLESGALNKKNLSPFDGNDSGTAMEHVLNFGHWKGVGKALNLTAVVCLFWSIALNSNRTQKLNLFGSWKQTNKA